MPLMNTLLRWSPRVLGLLLSAFLAMFAMDAIHEGVTSLLMHAAPALVALTVVALSWRWPWIGGVVFVAGAALYAATTLRRPDWILTISGPLLVTGILFLLSWRKGQTG